MALARPMASRSASVETFTKTQSLSCGKRWETFDAKHASLIAAHKEAAKLVRKASTQYRSSKYRVARKGGWGCSSYRDVQRSPNEHDEDDM